MNRSQILQSVLDYIDENIRSELSTAALAKKAGYSAYHFGRFFAGAIGIPPMSCVTWRKLQYALHGLSRGQKVIDAAMEYGFETRHDYEYHDHRDHGWYFDGKLRIGICIPIRQKDEELRKSMLRTDRIG